MSDELKPVTRRAFVPVFKWHRPTGVIYWRACDIPPPHGDRIRAELRQQTQYRKDDHNKRGTFFGGKGPSK